jgi:hypothetical protein
LILPVGGIFDAQLARDLAHIIASVRLLDGSGFLFRAIGDIGAAPHSKQKHEQK